MTDDHDILARARAALDAWQRYEAAPDSTLTCPPDDGILTDLVRGLIAEVEEWRAEVERMKGTLEACNDALVEVAETERDELRAEVERLRRAATLSHGLLEVEKEEAAALHSTVERVRRLHQPLDCRCGCGDTVCAECPSEPHPCPTIRALDKEAGR